MTIDLYTSQELQTLDLLTYFGLDKDNFIFYNFFSIYKYAGVIVEQPKWGDLDVNQHVNNVKYIGWILEVLFLYPYRYSPYYIQIYFFLDKYDKLS